MSGVDLSNMGGYMDGVSNISFQESLGTDKSSAGGTLKPIQSSNSSEKAAPYDSESDTDILLSYDLYSNFLGEDEGENVMINIQPFSFDINNYPVDDKKEFDKYKPYDYSEINKGKVELNNNIKSINQSVVNDKRTNEEMYSSTKKYDKLDKRITIFLLIILLVFVLIFVGVWYYTKKM